MPDSEPDIRTRLLAAAERCFYREGITATGVDALAAEAGVSKRTLYNQFGSKDALVAAYLETREEGWQRRLAVLFDEAGDDPLERVLAYARAYAEGLSDDFRGCALINAAAELAHEDDAGLAVVQRSLEDVTEGVRDILAGAGVAPREAARLAQHVLIVLEGAVAVGGIRRDPQHVSVAIDLLRDLLEPVFAAADAPVATG